MAWIELLVRLQRSVSGMTAFLRLGALAARIAKSGVTVVDDANRHVFARRTDGLILSPLYKSLPNLPLLARVCEKPEPCGHPQKVTSLLVDYTGRLFREGKTVIPGHFTGILNRFGTTAETWQGRLEKLKSGRNCQLRPILRRQPISPTRGRRTFTRASPRKPRRLPGTAPPGRPLHKRARRPHELMESADGTAAHKPSHAGTNDSARCSRIEHRARGHGVSRGYGERPGRALDA